MSEVLSLLTAQQIALIEQGEAARVDFFVLANREAEHSHERTLVRTSQVLVRGIAALRAAGWPVRLVCEVMRCSPGTVQQVETRHPDLVVTVRTRLGSVMLRAAALAAEEMMCRLEASPRGIENRELVAAAEKLGRMGAELLNAGGPATGGQVEEGGGFEAFLGALERVKGVPIDVASTDNAAISEENGVVSAVGAGAGAVDVPDAGTATGQIGDVERAKGEGGGEVLGAGGGDVSMQPGGGNFDAKGEGHTHGVD